MEVSGPFSDKKDQRLLQGSSSSGDNPQGPLGTIDNASKIAGVTSFPAINKSNDGQLIP